VKVRSGSSRSVQISDRDLLKLHEGAKRWHLAQSEVEASLVLREKGAKKMGQHKPSRRESNKGKKSQGWEGGGGKYIGGSWETLANGEPTKKRGTVGESNDSNLTNTFEEQKARKRRVWGKQLKFEKVRGIVG